MIERRAKRSSKTLATLTFGAVLLAVAAGLIGTRFTSPAQVAADAAPPRPSVITAAVAYGTLQNSVVLRAEVDDAAPVDVAVPDDLGDSLPVITNLNVAQGSLVHEGQVLMVVAGRPIVVMSGMIPAFRDLSPGENGIDVAELQAALRRLGYGIGNDPAGVFAFGTEQAVRSLYTHLGFDVVLNPPDADAQVASLAATVAADKQSATAADEAADEAVGAAGRGSAAAASARNAATSATAQLEGAEQALANAQATMGAMVPRGEVVFVPALPASVETLSVSLGGSAPAQGGAVCQIGSGKVVLETTADQSQLGEISVGQTAAATSEVSNVSFQAVVSSVSQQPTSQSLENQAAAGFPVSLTPTSALAPDLVGQNVAVSIDTAGSAGKVWIVPVAAVVTDAEGHSFIIIDNAGRQEQVSVEPGMTAGGREAVTPIDGSSLVAGEAVVLGMAPAG